MLSKTLKILLVDAEATHVEMIRHSLEATDSSTQLVVAGSLAEAEKFLQDNTPDMIISDYLLPDGKGMQLLPGDVEKRTMPIVMLMAHGDEKVAAASLKAGALDYIVKSDASLRDVSNMVQRSLREWEHIAQCRKAKRELAESEERLKLAMRVANQAWFDVNVQTGEACISPECAVMLGYEPETFKSSLQIWMDNLHPDDRDAAIAAYRSCLVSGEPLSMEYRRQSKSGDWLWMHSIGRVVEWDETKQALRIIGIHMLVSERKALEKVWKQYAFIVNSSQNFMNLIDRNYVYQSVNDAFLKAHGVRREEVIGKTVADIWGEETFNSEIKPIMDQCFSGKLTRHVFEFEFNSPVIGPRYYEASFYPYTDDEGKTELATVVTRDVTERKQAESSLKENEEKFESLIQNMSEGVALHKIINDANGCPVDYRILDINPAFERHTGLSADKVRGQLATALYEVHTAPYLEDYARVALTGEPCSFETAFSPLQRHFEVSVFSPGKGLFATVFTDITQRKQSEQQLQERFDEIERINRLMVGRELKMEELRQEIKRLKGNAV
ncbi:MAG: hypothetical protein CO186_11140 [Zetaproteobacteria bacterium CG_4_9_14_3_um_filter_49_83]|nr:MAG: hypothetical protein AUJ56_03470 [Zetaproteobacteria bacterium CG1_02_49_23]PIQ34685.1 MAG: hypothetical protein COW62_00825 [Zetaproteobacteria bacterium CG17_big_fil_post_rev_8_21_14_2_50_50_13]PIV30015.1 MAG: hypothetical protein COS35_09040 [Zetaproteobacteria bacterium CG02_land_8_20_14_3_00_50_9]PIY54980.1 MAG: hypothetical protein COZ00_11735 [Zetaproteobacteria bacterium CG_4_10_14_0_8_um_filter_49_80]PJA34268.1 MAG: hypothetical protein CO186_11140 [Zetaproteobacteria bacterium